MSSRRDAPRHLGEAVAEQIHHRCHHPFERGCAGQVFQPADGRLRAQIIAGLGQPADRHLEGRVGFERVAVVALGIARRDQQRAIPDYLGNLMHHPIGIARIFDARRQALGDLEPPFYRRQQQYSAVRGQPAAVEPDMHRLACKFRRCRSVIPRSCRSLFRHDIARLRRLAGGWFLSSRGAAVNPFRWFWAGFVAGCHRRDRCDGHCERGGRGWRRHRSGRRSPRAICRLGSGW